MSLHFDQPLRLNPLARSSLALCLLLLAQAAWAHGGGLNSEGCHNNRKTGDYHCHRGGSSGVRGGSAAPSTDEQAPATAASQRGFYAASDANERPVFANCAQVRAAGLAPIYRGQPGYAAHLDRDNDGVACEPYRSR